MLVAFEHVLEDIRQELADNHPGKPDGQKIETLRENKDLLLYEKEQILAKAPEIEDEHEAPAIETLIEETVLKANGSKEKSPFTNSTYTAAQLRVLERTLDHATAFLENLVAIRSNLSHFNEGGYYTHKGIILITWQKSGRQREAEKRAKHGI